MPWGAPRAQPGAGQWFDGRGFWLNEVQAINLNQDSPLLTEDERSRMFQVSSSKECYFALDLSDTRSGELGLTGSVNGAAIALHDLNHDPADLRAALFTSFDLIDDVSWLQKELRLESGVDLVLCTHLWPELKQERDAMWTCLSSLFDDVVWHFPGFAHLSLSSGQVGLAPDATEYQSSCTIHAKLILLEFSDRLRVAVTSANLRESSWQSNNEVVWVEDFRRARGPPCARSLLQAGSFARTLAHFVSNVLRDAPNNQRSTWLARLLAFDFSTAAARLVASLPGIFPPARSVEAHEVALRLALEAFGEDDPDVNSILACVAKSESCEGCVQLRKTADVWEVWLDQSEAELRIGCLQADSAKALFAAQSMGLGVARESDHLEAVDVAGAQFPWIAVELLPTVLDSLEEEDGELLEGWSASLPLLRVLLQGPRGSSWSGSSLEHANLAELLTACEEDYGLLALQRCLGQEVWRLSDERHYAALTGSLSKLDIAWFEEFDRCCGRKVSAGQLPGPAVVVPGEDQCISQAYLHLAAHDHEVSGASAVGRLAEHDSPWHSPGRQLLPNHAKLITRLFLDEESEGLPYGWVYLGSHNLTFSAWGTVHHLLSGGEVLWSGNRELGVLLVEPRQSAPSSRSDSLFSSTPFPFDLPLRPTSLEGRRVLDESPSEEEWQWSDWQQTDWQLADWQTWESWQEWRDECSKLPGIEDSTEALDVDWRLREESWWWWFA